MTKKRALIGILLAATLLGVVPAFSLTAAGPIQSVQEVQNNLLQNPGFEGLSCRPGSEPPECLDNWTHDVHWTDEAVHGNIFTPQGWVTWWRRGGDYGQPEVKTIPNVPPFTGELNRIRSGHYAVLMFTYYRLQDMGLYQCVSGLQPASMVQLTAHAHGWSCDDAPGSNMGYSCGDPWNQVFQVGIEPNGIADPFAPSVVWSGDQKSPDHYSLIGPVTAQVGEGGSVCVFLRSKTKWMYKYQDAYWDDASLVMTEEGVPPTNTPKPPPPPPPTNTPGPSPTPRPTPTPRPDGAIVHVVQSGDTLYGISLMYDVPLEQIRQLNASALGGSDIINVGQELVIAIPSETATPVPPPPTNEPEQATESNLSPGSPPAASASICVAAYKDRNGNERWDKAEEDLLPNVQFKVADASGTVVGQYTSDGVNEPHCITGLATGSYRVIQDPPPEYAPSGQAEQAVAVAEGTSLELHFGNVRSDEAGDAGAPTDEGDGGGGDLTPVLSTLAIIAGVLMLVVALVAAVLFILNRQRMYA